MDALDPHEVRGRDLTGDRGLESALERTCRESLLLYSVETSVNRLLFECLLVCWVLK